MSAYFFYLNRWLEGLLLLLALLPAHTPAAALPAPVQSFLRQFGPAEGLSQPFIYRLLQDRQGYLWLGTAEGLVRYDGNHFRTFTTRDGLAEDFVTGLWQDPASGALGVTHAQGSRSIQLANNLKFNKIAAIVRGGPAPGHLGAPHPDTARLGAYRRRYHLALPPDVVPTCLLEDREGNAWFGTAGQGLWQHADRYLSLWPPASGPLGLAAGVAVARPAALGGGYWVGTAAGVRTVAPGQPAQQVRGLTQGFGSAVTALAYAPGSGLWVGTVADGVYVLPLGTGPGTAPAIQHFTTANELLHNSIYAIPAACG